ncbi:DUF6270 domain-containing protein [Methylobacterium fujisawaense]|uniref:DUF6270 domain-containing protein n=1 Tax=Methylobacterium fujisawaense TaxID=107400 RepID=UPI002F355CED
MAQSVASAQLFQISASLNTVNYSSKNKAKVLSLGGCVTHDVAKYCESIAVQHCGHLWRRPTIPLMSDMPSRFEDLPDVFPSVLRKYWQDDFRKTHWREISSSDANILLFDITRDIWCKIIDLNNGVYVIDPMSVKGIMWDGPLEESHVNEYLGKNFPRLSYKDNIYFDLLCEGFDKFIEFAIEKFDMVILNELYFTDRLASEQSLYWGDRALVEEVNDFLARMYKFIAERYNGVIINRVSRKALLTGSAVNWSGPTYTHYIPEAVSLFVENANSIILGKNNNPGSFLIKNALDRAKRYEDLLRSRDQAAHQRDEQTALLAAERQQQDVLRGELAAVIHQRDEQSAWLAAERQMQEALRGELAAAIYQRDEQTTRLAIELQTQEALRGEVAATIHQRDEQAAQLAAELQTQEVLRGELAALIHQRDEQSAQLAAERHALDVLRGELAALIHQRDEQSAQLAAERQSQEALRGGLTAAIHQRDEQTAQLIAERQTQEVLRGEVAALIHQRDEQAAQLAAERQTQDMLRQKLSTYEHDYRGRHGMVKPRWGGFSLRKN